ncbi:MAG: hypothetical protein H6740_14055 [Alphaproteobacteria bacterium]|nr:hypothetical protein [Alphaproteobacteria bacterium]
MRVPLPLGDVLDRITILRIKSRRIAAPDKLANVQAELQALQALWDAQGFPPLAQERSLEQVNEALWDVEDALRRHEAAGDFGPEFVRLARAVYQTNDRRAALKREVNLQLGSEWVEEKDYVAY